jgi:predicted O-methyltransferase YrrM
MGKGKNGRILVNLLKDREHQIGAEVGVFEGDTSLKLLEGLPELCKLFCIDQWTEDKEFLDSCPNKKGHVFNAHWPTVRKKFITNVLKPFEHRVMALQMKSCHAAELINAGELDFAFIDGTHTYLRAKQDIDLWSPKVRKGGVICGDDFNNKPNYGVIQAVKESFGNNFKVRGKIWYTIK